ncbi:MAG: DUF1616 domain-containing protein [Patescibacteria group bacterium]
MEFALDIIKLSLTLFFLFFLPGYFTLKVLYPEKNKFGYAGEAILAFTLSIAVVNFLMMIVDKAGIAINFISVSLGLGFFTAGAAFVHFRKRKIIKPQKTEGKSIHKGWLAFFIILLLSIVARLIYLIPKVIPHTTDSGHHMYWAKHIVDFAELPQYGIPDVIIGEHIVFAATSILSGISLISSLPNIILFLINIFSLIAIFAVVKQISSSFLPPRDSFALGLLSLLAIGVLYAISSPQGKYINGGVVGNILGGLFIPVSIYLFAKAIQEKDTLLSAIGVFIVGTMAYTHHLSTFVFLYFIIGFTILSIAYFALLFFFKKTSKQKITKTLKSIINLKSSLVGIALLLFVFLIRVPSYLNSSAISTAVGEPSKSTRTGVIFGDLLLSTGPWRVFYSFLGTVFLGGILFLIFSKRQVLKDFAKKYYSVTLSDPLKIGLLALVIPAWFWVIFLMTSFPDVLKVDIPSGRIANYLTYPSAALCVFGLFLLLKPIIKKLDPKASVLFFALIISTGYISGSTDISEWYPEDSKKNAKMYAETLRASRYLAEKTTSEEVILKDHVHLPADSWVKVFLMRGYEKPLSRALLKRYDDPVKDRETCTRDMISIPDSEIGKSCYEETGVEYIILRNGYDTQQFQKSENFSMIYTSENVVIYQRFVR